MALYVGPETTGMYAGAAEARPFLRLLWGDAAEPTGEAPQAGRTRVRARGATGWVDTADLAGRSLLECYFIDVGQGDGVLIVGPEDPNGKRQHVMVDCGYRRDQQPMGKNASDFVDWKFAKDQRRQRIELDALFVSHCDADHYGGLADLFDPDQYDGGATPNFSCNGVTVERIYHPGVAWWRPSKRFLGEQAQTATGDPLLVQLLDDRPSVVAALDPATPAGRRLQGDYGAFWKRALDVTRSDAAPTEIGRLAAGARLPAGLFGHGVSCKVLGPIEHRAADGRPGVRDLGGESQNTNGNSVLLSLRYGDARILLTGDLNIESMQALLGDMSEGQRRDLRADVAKACHHGSDKVSFQFLGKIAAGCTVISSGDNEGHGHPRPSAVAASAITGHKTVVDDRLLTPLVYSTEIARSVRIGRPESVTVGAAATGGAALMVGRSQLGDVTVGYRETRSGDLRPRRDSLRMPRSAMVVGTIYGLVNVRTDGTTILCAVRSEKDHDWDIETFPARF